MARGPVRRPNLTRDTVLRIAKTGVIVLAAASSPHLFHRLAKEYFKDRSRKATLMRARKLWDLKHRKLISFMELDEGRVKIELTQCGKKLTQAYELDNLTLLKTKWDKQWRVILYDIPLFQKRASQAFSEKLKQMGLFPIQRSVWVSPYECLKELEFLASVFEIDMNQCVFYFTAPHLPREKELRKHFGL